MRRSFADQLRCPRCRSEGSLRLLEESTDENEVREGALECARCGAEYPGHRGVAHLLHDPPEHIRVEAAGLERFAERMRDHGWDRERIKSLPYLPDGYWYVQARSMDQLLRMVPFQPGQTVLDVGSNTCWASNHFAVRGLQATALDIATTELQGLYTADVFLESGDVFFERVLGTMDDLPLASSSLDYVYCCEVLHHNDLASLRRTFAEAYRVLRPGGSLLVVNETIKVLRDRAGVDVEHFDVAEFEGYEHAFWAARYVWEACRAGFHVEVLEPYYVPFFGDTHLNLPENTPPLRAVGAALAYALRPNPLARRLYLAWLYAIAGGASLNMIAHKRPGFGRPGAKPGLRRLLRAARGLTRPPRMILEPEPEPQPAPATTPAVR